MSARTKALVPNAAIAESLAKLIRHPELDAILIASQSHLHLDQLEAVSRMKPVPVIVEKPLFTSPEQQAGARRVSERAASPVWVAMECRYMPPIAKFLKRMNATTGGAKMLSIREHRFPFLPKVGSWNRPSCLTGGTLVAKCCHFFDLMRHAIGDQPIRVMASAGRDVNHLTESVGGYPSDFHDNAFVIVDFDSGVRAMLDLSIFPKVRGSRRKSPRPAPTDASTSSFPARRVSDQTTWGRHPISRIVVSPRSRLDQKEHDIPIDPILLESGDHNGATNFQQCLFLETVLPGREPEVIMTSGVEAARMGYAARLSAVRARLWISEFAPGGSGEFMRLR